MAVRLVVAAVVLFACGPDDPAPVAQETASHAASSPAPLPPQLAHHRSIVVGWLVQCAAYADELFCWGSTWDLPRFPSVDVTRQWERSPVTRIAVHDAPRAVAAGSRHICVLHEDGAVHCSGREGGDGLLGFETCWVRYEVDHPVRLLAPATDIAIDGGLTCALLDDGRVECWGLPSSLGGAAICGPRLVMTETGHELRCARLDAGACVDPDGAVWLWGAPAGRRGADALTATRAEGLARAREVVVTNEEVCVIDDDRAVSCTRGGLPLPVPLRAKASAIDCAGDGCCVITADGALACWGAPHLRALSTAASPATDVRALALGGETLCWSTGDAHEIWCASRAPSAFGTGMRDDPILAAPEARPIALTSRAGPDAHER